jgi:hypothetical protein
LNLEGGGAEVLFEEDLSVAAPDPTAAPPWAQRW